MFAYFIENNRPMMYLIKTKYVSKNMHCKKKKKIPKRVIIKYFKNTPLLNDENATGNTSYKI